MKAHSFALKIAVALVSLPALTLAQEGNGSASESPSSAVAHPQQPHPQPDPSQVRRDARRSLRPELAAFSQYWGLSTNYPEEALVDVGQEVEASALEPGPKAYGWGLGLGARYHYLDRLGIQARLVLGLQQVYAGVSKQFIAAGSGVLELTPIVGPLGRFYAGPTLFGGALLFDGRAFLYPEGDPGETLVPVFVYGAGGELGLHLGPREEVALLLKVLVGEVAAPSAPLGTNNSVAQLAAGASIAF